MSGLTMTRRSFVKAAAVMGAAATIAVSAPTGTLAEDAYAQESDGAAVKKVRTCCRACGKNECGVIVTVKDGRAIKIEGDAETAFHSMGNCCSKSQASLQACYHPDRNYHPMKRTNPKDADDPGWERIDWDEAYQTIAEKFQELMDKYGGESMFFMGGTSRIWTQHAYGAWPQLVGSPNAVTAWQICKGPRHMATEMVSEFAWSWMATTDRPRVFVRWGTATEISNYDESCRTTVDIANMADTFIDIDPRLNNLGHEADIHQFLTPGTDGALGLAWTDVIIENELYNDLYVKRWTDAPFLVCEDMEASGGDPIWHKIGWTEGAPMANHLVKECDVMADGSTWRYLVWDTLAGTDAAHPLHQTYLAADPTGHLTYFDAEAGLWENEPDVVWDKFYPNPQPNLPEQTVPGVIAEQSPFDPEIDPAIYGTFTVNLADGKPYKVRPVWDMYAERCKEYAPEKVEEIVGIKAEDIRHAALTWATPVDPSTGYGNGGLQYGLAPEHACNSIQNNRIFDALVGITGNLDTPAGNRGPSIGLYSSVDDAQPTIVSQHASNDGDLTFFSEKIVGKDKIPVLSWWQQWADANAIHDAILTSDPYPVRGGLCEASGILNQGNTLKYLKAIESLDFFVCQDLWKNATTSHADILLPVFHWLEVDCPRLSQGSTGAQGADCRCVEPPADCHFDVQILVDVYKAMGVPWCDEPEELGFEPDEYWPEYHRIYEKTTLAKMDVTWDEYVEAFQEHGWWDCRAINPEIWGTYRRYECGRVTVPDITGLTPAGNPMKGFDTPTRKQEIWSTVIDTYMPGSGMELPSWEPAAETALGGFEKVDEYPFLATTGRRIPTYFHSEHRQLPWCRELWPVPRVEINPTDAEGLGIEQGDWVWIETERAKIRQCADLYYGIQPGVINMEHQWWFPELPEADKGLDLCGCNCLINGDVQDPICGSSNLRAYNVNIYKATPENSPNGQVVPQGHDGTPIIVSSHDARLKEWLPDYEIREEA